MMPADLTDAEVLAVLDDDERLLWKNPHPYPWRVHELLRKIARLTLDLRAAQQADR
jgi:hypothetical protein